MAQRQFRSDDTDKWKYGLGDGHDGSTYAVPAIAGCSGSSGSPTLSLDAASTFSNGDLVWIKQMRGTGAGNWELNKIQSGAGTTTLTLAHNLINTYTDSGASQAQILEMKEYKGLTNAGTITPSAWDGNKGGLIGWFDKGTTTNNGTLNLSGIGFRGGTCATSTAYAAYQGEGTGGDGTSGSTSANGNGGGAGIQGGSANGGGGGGGGNANNGTTANGTGGGSGGTGGSTVGNADGELKTMFLGGGGGAGSQAGSSGGNGGGEFLIVANSFVNSGTGLITLNGTNGAGDWPGGGGGAGGSGLFKCKTFTNSGSITATAGSGSGSHSYEGGAGSVGRFHLDYSVSYTAGTITPSIDVTLDTTIKPLSSSKPLLFAQY